MHDKAVRRRRAVLALLVILSLSLLTAYFGESGNGGLHAVQRGAMEVLAPIQEGANRALKPFRDPGNVGRAAGAPGHLPLAWAPTPRGLRRGDLIITAGIDTSTRAAELP